MDVCGHEIFPELIEEAEPQKRSSNPLGDLMRNLRKQEREETAARVAAEREKQQKEAEFHLSDTEDYFPHDIRDARVSGHTTCRLLELPPDVLNLIVDHSAPRSQSLPGDFQTYTAALKHLRLLHPCFAYLRLLLNRLFGNLTMRADPDQLKELHKGIERIAPFVKKITFCSSKVKRADMAKRKRRDSSHEIRRVLGRRVEKTLEDGRLLTTWTGVLQQCQNLQDFAIIRGHVDEDNIDLGPSAHALINVVAKCIVAANKSPRNISIDHKIDNEMIWTTMPEWRHLDYRRLEHLDFSLVLQCLLNKYNSRVVFKREAMLLLSHVLRASSGSLQSLSSAGHTLKALVDMQMPVLSVLRKLHLSGSDIFVDPVRLSRTIAHFGSLRELRLEKLKIKPYKNIQHWQPVFGAIRRHPNELYVDLVDLHIDSPVGPKCRLNVTLRLPQPVRKVADNDSVTETIEKMIINYMSKHGEWYLLDSWDPALYEESNQEPLGEDWQVDS
ncbi:hypothetical protein DOTSEDRAFT_36447 [Dothistroma septosporum NZE10]|uniref:Uncharacterized protein n=1 Tax=Dothistroma septosporum (strain NZE10 / CBS 128990) TaxID=675120 RepID=N1PMF1_DOTSN|nr:hypothetical protein DOTSEDRAFT_36447 [Dothistroma septosporum NZE10]